MNFKISKSVGLGGGNLPHDVSAVQTVLNQIPTSDGGPAPLLAVDGLVGPKTVGAIYGFQRMHFGSMHADGRVDPNQRTMQKILELLKNTIGPNPPGQSNFTGFTPEQIHVLQKAVVDARSMIDNTVTRCSNAFAMREPDKAVTSLRHNFDVDVKAEGPIAFAQESTNLSLILGQLAKIRWGLVQDFPFVYEPKPGFPEAWVVGVNDPTVHVRPGYFDNTYNTPLSRAGTLIHERAHTVLKTPGHPGIPGGGGLATLVVPAHEDKRPHYTSGDQFFYDALRNPYNFEWLCVSLDPAYQETGNTNQLSVSRIA